MQCPLTVSYHQPTKYAKWVCLLVWFVTAAIVKGSASLDEQGFRGLEDSPV